jgi:hypothetical protein
LLVSLLLFAAEAGYE